MIYGGSVVIITAQLKRSAANLYRSLPRSRAELKADIGRRWSVLKEAGVRQLTLDAYTTAGRLCRMGVDALTLVRPGKAAPGKDNFAFAIHPRDLTDVYRFYPFFRYLPDSLVKEICRFLPPTRLATIEGGISPVTGKLLSGQLISLGQTPEIMQEDGQWAAFQAVLLAKLTSKLGIEVLGLGALLPSLTRYGTTITKHVPGLSVTTGHSYTALLVAQTALKVLDAVAGSREQLVAVVGAGGSIGAVTSRLLGASGVKRLLLVDREMKLDKAISAAREMAANGNGVTTDVTSNLEAIRQAGIVISVTNAEKMLLKAEHLRPGMIIIDDAQPANVSQALAEQHPEITVLKVLAKVPGLRPNFDFGLGTPPEVTFTCLAETTILAAEGWRQNFTSSNIDLAWIAVLERLAAEHQVAPPAVFYSFDGREITSAELRDKFSRFLHAAKTR
jgi:fatty aldehyde-generating acyl-ACP reductase